MRLVQHLERFEAKPRLADRPGQWRFGDVD